MEQRHFIVTQERELKVTATTIEEACQIATAALHGYPPPKVFGAPISNIEEKAMTIREDF